LYLTKISPIKPTFVNSFLITGMILKSATACFKNESKALWLFFLIASIPLSI